MSSPPPRFTQKVLTFFFSQPLRMKMIIRAVEARWKNIFYDVACILCIRRSYIYSRNPVHNFIHL